MLRGPQAEQEPPSREALRAYGILVAAMVVAKVVAIPVGARILSNVLDTPNAVLVGVVFVVGAHFLPFAHGFPLSVFRRTSRTVST